MSLEDNETDALEYVLGLLDRDERRAFEAALLDDPDLAAAVWRAEEDLAPLALAVAARPVPPRVKRGIERRLFGTAGTVRRAERRAVRFWRNLAGIFGAAALGGALLLAVVVARPELIVPPREVWVAAIVRPDGSVTLARLRGDGSLVAEPFPVEATDRSAELWVVPTDGAPVSLGLLEAAERSRFAVPRSVDALFRRGSRLVITLEPPGGSPTGAPTGPAVGAGDLTQI